MTRPRAASARNDDPPAARLAFYIFGDTSACARFLLCVVVCTLTLAALAALAPAVAYVLASGLTGTLGGRTALRWWRARREADS